MATPPENVETTQVVDTPATGAGKQSVTPQQLAIVGGVVLVILLGLVYFFFLRGGEEEELPPPPVAEGIPAPDETAAPSDGDGDDDGDEGDVETFEVFAPRDPFEPLISAGAGGGGGTTTDGGDGDVTVDGDGDGTGDGDVTVDGDPEPDGDTIGNHRVEVVDVYTEGRRGRAQIRVDGTVYTVDEGEGFAENFRLVSTSGSCATILFGDDEFTLCEGEEILK
jgi:hypothetical protein